MASTQNWIQCPLNTLKAMPCNNCWFTFLPECPWRTLTSSVSPMSPEAIDAVLGGSTQKPWWIWVHCRSAASGCSSWRRRGCTIPRRTLFGEEDDQGSRSWMRQAGGSGSEETPPLSGLFHQQAGEVGCVWWPWRGGGGVKNKIIWWRTTRFLKFRFDIMEPTGALAYSSVTGATCVNH